MEERRDSVRRHARTLIAAAAIGGALCGTLIGTARACPLPPGVRVESERLVLSYRTIPSKIVVGEHFVLEFAFCPKKNAKPSDKIRLDAHMPEHRHGMNYRPNVIPVTPLGPGRYRSEGWLFHMPGRWEFVFELGAERLADSIRVE